MFDLNQDEFDKLSDQHQLFANSLGESGVKINLNSYNLEKLVVEDVSLTDSFITESIFQDNFFNNVEIFDAALCGCKFENVTFERVNFVKTDLSFCFFKDCKFINSKLKCCETYRTVFEDVQFRSCDLYDIFSYAKLKNVVFSNMDLEKITLYETVVHDIKLINVRNLNIKSTILSLNIGDFENENILMGEDAIEYFQKIVYKLKL